MVSFSVLCWPLSSSHALLPPPEFSIAAPLTSTSRALPAWGNLGAGSLIPLPVCLKGPHCWIELTMPVQRAQLCRYSPLMGEVGLTPSLKAGISVEHCTAPHPLRGVAEGWHVASSGID